MRPFSGFTVALVVVLLVLDFASALPRTRRQAELHDDNSLSPDNDPSNANDEENRGKRFLEPIAEAGWKTKNAILGLVFGVTSPSPSQQKRTSRQRQSSKRRTTTTEKIPVFDRNKVTLDFPDELFGGSVSLLIRSTKVIGNVVQNTAERYQTFLSLFRPFFRGVFAIKGLDPPTTTQKPKKASLKLASTTTTTTTEAPEEISFSDNTSTNTEETVIVDLLKSIQNNEVRRR